MNFTHTHTHTHRFFSVAMALMLVLFGTVGCNEEVQAPEPLVEVSPAEALQELKSQFRKENDALAFHLRMLNANFSSNSLITDYFNKRIQTFSNKYSFDELLVASSSKERLRVRSSLSPSANRKIDSYLNQISNFPNSKDYLNMLEQEFTTLSKSDLTIKSNFEIAIWLVLNIEAIQFVLDNKDLYPHNAQASNSNAYLTTFAVADKCTEKLWSDQAACEEDLSFQIGITIGGVMLTSVLSGGLGGIPAAIIGSANIAWEIRKYYQCQDNAIFVWELCKEVHRL